MVERITDPHKPVSMMLGCYRIPDGDVVPHNLRTQQQPVTADEILSGLAAAPPPERTPTRYQWLVLWSAVAVVALGVVIGSLR